MAGKLTYDEVTSIGDPLLDDNFEIIFSGVPSAVGEASTFRLFCKTGVLPGYTLDEVLQEAFGHTIRFAGKKTFSGSITIEFNENSQMKMYTAIKTWGDLIRGSKTQLAKLFKGGDKSTIGSGYAAKAQVNVFRQDGTTAKSYNIVNVWPGQLPDLSFSGGGQALTISVDFKYDIVTDSDGN
jgi:hypothetical protein